MTVLIYLNILIQLHRVRMEADFQNKINHSTCNSAEISETQKICKSPILIVMILLRKGWAGGGDDDG